MLPLAELKPGLSLVGLEPNLVATVVAVTPIAANAVQVFYKAPDGALAASVHDSISELLSRAGPLIGPAASCMEGGECYAVARPLPPPR